MATLPVKWYSCFMRGIPPMTATIGSMITVLDALFINGFGQVTTTNIVVQNKIATINLANSETFLKYSVVEITGDDQLKGEYRVIESTNTYIKIKVDIPDQTFTNSIYVKYAALGWTKVPGTSPANVALYKPGDPRSDFLLYVDDRTTSSTQVRLCRGATNLADISSFTKLIDYVPRDIPYGYVPIWTKTFSSGTASTFYIGDNSTFYYNTGYTSSGQSVSYDYYRHGATIGCGDIKRYNPDDKLSAFILAYSGLTSPSSFSSNSFVQYFSLSSNKNRNFSGYSHSTFLGTVRGEKQNDEAFRMPDGGAQNTYSGYNGNLLEFQQSDLALELQKILASSNTCTRGEYPGIYFIPYHLPGMEDMVFEEGSGNMNGKIILFKSCSAAITSYNGTSPGGSFSYLAFDITGPWK